MNAVAYIRYASTAIEDKQKDWDNPQELAIKSYCYSNNIWLMETFRDMGVSGSNFERQGWLVFQIGKGM